MYNLYLTVRVYYMHVRTCKYCTCIDHLRMSLMTRMTGILVRLLECASP